MSVLIKNMTLPATCSECVIEQHDENYYGDESNYRCPFIHYGCTEKVRETDVLFDCPLVEVPPHGRLIDADALNGKMYHNAFEIDSDMQKWDSGCWVRYKMFENNLRDAPTVIEADHVCETCKYQNVYGDITMQDDHCGGCCESNDKWVAKGEEK